MKKTKLKNIIRESVQKLIKEQWLPPAPGHKEVYGESCGGSFSAHFCITNMNPQVGDIFKTQDYHHSWYQHASTNNNRKFFITKIIGNCNPENHSWAVNPATGTQEPSINNANVIHTITGTCSECKNCCNYYPHNPPGCVGSANNGIWIYPNGGQQIQATGACWDRCQGTGYSGKTYDCKPGWKEGIGGKCVEVQGAGGQFANLQDCLFSGCEGIGPQGGPTTTIPQGGFSPLTTDPQSMIEPDDEISRMQDLANIK